MKISLHFDKNLLRSFILKDTADRLNLWMRSLRTKTLPFLEGQLYKTLASEPEGISLQGGSLQGELGVTDPVDAIRSISRTIVGNMLWNIVPVVALSETRIKGSLFIGLLRTDLSEILNLPQGSFRAEGGSDIQWLSWLLTKGSTPQVRGYRFTSKDFRGHSRTGLGVMAKSRHGVNWRVPRFFSGTITNNWVTRSLDKLAILLIEFIEKDLKATFG